MRTTNTTRGFLAIVLASLVMSSIPAGIAGAAEDWAPGRYLQQAMGRAMGAALAIDEESTFGYASDGVCLWGAFVRRGETCSFSRPLLRNREYAFVAAGDNDARDIDLEVVDRRGRVLAQDTLTDREAVIRFTPPATADYFLRVRLYAADDNSFCVIAVLEDGGIHVPRINVDTVTSRFFSACERVAMVATEDGRSTGFLTEPNQATIYGTVLAPEDDVQIGNISLGDQPVAIISTGDTQVDDIDLHLFDRQGRMLIEDIALDANPVIVFEPRPRDRYRLRINNPSTHPQRTLVLTGTLQMHR